VFAGLTCRRQRVLVAAEAVEEQRACPLGDGHPESLTPRDHLLEGGFDQLGDIGFAPLQRGERQSAVGRELASGRLGDRFGFYDEGRGRGKLAGEQVDVDACAEGDR
jgi:hypothetical protein